MYNGRHQWLTQGAYMVKFHLMLLLLISMLLMSSCTTATPAASQTESTPTIALTPSPESDQSYSTGDGTLSEQPQMPTPLPVTQRPPPKPCVASVADATTTDTSVAVIGQTAAMSTTNTPVQALRDLSRSPRDMKILVIAADGKETDLLAMTAVLDRLNIPYETLIATQNKFNENMLWDGKAYGCYQGIILTTGNLTYFDADSQSWKSAFTIDDWKALWQYEAMFGVRQVTSYTYPGGWPDTYGMTYVSYQDTGSAPLQAHITEAGRQIFPYLNANNPITLKNARTYLATVAVTETAVTTPLLTTDNPQGSPYVVAAVKRYTDGRENLAVMVENNPNLIHSLLLSYGVVNWLTKGVFLGERHVAMDIQPDDIFIGNTMWDVDAKSDTTGQTFRMSDSDLTALVNWQKSVRTRFPLAADLKLEMPFVGIGAVNHYAHDTLTGATLSHQTEFNWINHTYNHTNLNHISAADATKVLQLNDAFAHQSGFTAYSRDAMVQPDISGLDNPDFLQAAYAFGIRFLISDTSRPDWNNPTPNTGFYSTAQPGLLIIPRHATSLFYNVRTPEQWVSEYNCYYGPQATCAGGQRRFWDHDLTYAEVLDKESDKWLQYLLKWDIDPIMFHQPNLGTYDGEHSLLGDLVEATLTKYSAVYALPVLNLTQREIGIRMANRMTYDASGTQAILYPGDKIMLTTTRDAIVPITGIAHGDSQETYGGQSISYITMKANQPLTFTIP